MKNSGIIIIGAAIAGYLLFAGKGQSEGGTGGSLITPAFPDWFTGVAPASVAPASVAPATSAVSSPVSSDVDWNTLIGTLNPFITESGKGNVSFSASAYATKKATDPAVGKFLGYVPESTKSIVSLPAWMGGSVFTENVNKLKSEGYSYEKISPAGEFTFSKTITDSKKAESTNTGNISLAAAPASVRSALSGSVGAISVSQQGGATVYTQARSSGRTGGGSRSGFSSGW